MRFRSFVLGGVAAAGLIGAGALAPATAFTRHPGTPAEHQQTDELNAQQLTNAQGQTPSQAGAASGDPQNGQQMAASTQAVGADTSQSASNAGPVSLDRIANPPETLANASGETSNGQAIGAVQKVAVGSDGKAQTVDIALLGKQSKTVTVDASQLTYDQSRNVVVAQLSADKMQAMPASPRG